MPTVIHDIAAKDRKKIVRVLNQDRRVVLVKQRNGYLRIYDLEKYESHKRQMGEVIRIYKPWVKRKKSLLGPIGERKIGVANHLSRTAIYESR